MAGAALRSRNQNGSVNGVVRIGSHTRMWVARRVAVGASLPNNQCVRKIAGRVSELRQRRCVTGLATQIARRYMVSRHDRGLGTRVGPSMARRTIFRRALEQALGMASLTAHLLVPKIQYKTRAVVVKVSSLCLRTRNGKKLQQGKNRERHNAAHRQTSPDVIHRHQSSHQVAHV